MKTRENLVLIPVMLSLLLASCNLPVATPAPMPDGTPVPVTTELSSSTGGPTPTLPGPAIAHLAAGQAINIIKIHMLDPYSGWGIGGLVHAQDHIFRTQDGGDTWRDVTPPQPVPAAGDAPIAIGISRTPPLPGSAMAPSWCPHRRIFTCGSPTMAGPPGNTAPLARPFHRSSLTPG